MVLLRPVEDVEGIGGVYGARLRLGGIGTLDDLRCATVNEIGKAAGSGMKRARAWKAQAWFMALGMPKDVAEVIVCAGICYTLQELALAGVDRIMHAIQLDQDESGPSPKKIPKTARIDVTRSMVRDWQRKAIFALGFYPSAPFLPAGHPKGGYASVLSYSKFSIYCALEDAAEEALGDIPWITPEERLDIRNQLVEKYRSSLFSPPTDEDQENVRRVLANMQRVMADALLKHLDLWPAVPWLRGLALRTTTDVIDFTLPRPDIFQRDLFQGISELQIKGLLIGQLARKIRTQGLYTLFAVVDEIRRSLSDPGLCALDGWRAKGGLGNLDGTGVKIGLVGHSWDRAHPSFAKANLTPLRSRFTSVKSNPDSPWIGLDTAVLSQIAASPVDLLKKTRGPDFGPAGIAPSAQVVLYGIKSEDVPLAKVIRLTTKFLGKGDVLLVPRTCVGVARNSRTSVLFDLPLIVNIETHNALLHAARKGIIVILPAGLGRQKLGNRRMDKLLSTFGASKSSIHTVSGPVAQPGLAERLAECRSAGVLIIGTSSPWSNRGADVIRLPDIPFTVAGGTKRVVAGAGFTTGWHGPHAAAATAAGLAALLVQATTSHGNFTTAEQIRRLLQAYTVPSWAKLPRNLPNLSLSKAAHISSFGVATEEDLDLGKRAKHRFSAMNLLEEYGSPRTRPQPETEIWSAAMVVGTWGNAFGNGNATGHGYRPSDSAGSLSDASFTHRGTTYTIRGIGTARIGRNAPYRMGLGISPEFQSGDKSRLTFYIGDSKYSLSDSGDGWGHFGSSRAYLWGNNLPSWNPRQQIAVKISFQPTVPDAPVLTAINEENQVRLFWSSPYDGGCNIIRHDYRQKVEDEPFSLWMAIPTSAAGEANANSYTVADLDNPTECIFEIRAVNIAGTGEASNQANVTEPIVPVCDRTAQVRDAIVAAAGVSDCGDVTPAHLAAIKGTLDLRNQGITALQPGDFSGLSALTRLWLGRNQLSSLPKGVFDGLPSLTFLGLLSNQLNRLDAGIFEGLSALKRLFLAGNSVAPLPITISLESAGEGQFKATAPTGAPFEIVLPIRIIGPGTIEGGATSLTIATGSVESEPIRMTRTEGDVAVTIDIGDLPRLPARHRGYSLVKSADLPLEVLSANAGTR